MATTTRIIGQQTIIGTVQEIDALGDVPERVDQVYGRRLEPFQASFRDQGDMPVVNTLGARAKGVWRYGARRVIMSRALGSYWVPDTYGHEATHVLDDDFLGRPQRREICQLMRPIPTGWGDLTIDPNDQPLYVNAPGEAFASYGAAAMLGVRVAFATLYQRRVPIELWTQLKAIALASLDCDPAQLEQLQRDLADALSRLSTSQGRITVLEDAIRLGVTSIDAAIVNLGSVDLTVRAMAATADALRDAAGTA